jgi:biopolymer transport protein ExbB
MIIVAMRFFLGCRGGAELAVASSHTSFSAYQQRIFMSLLQTMGERFHDGGWGMWPILFCSIVTIALIVERAVYLVRASVDKDKLLALLKSQVMSGNVAGAIKVCSGNPNPMTRIVQAGLMKFNRSDEEVQSAMDEASLRELPKINARTPYLAMLSNFAVMAGLVGTISGMIDVFGKVKNSSDSSGAATELAGGISEALNCTFFGISISLIGLVGFALLQGKTTKVIDDINEVTVQVVNLVTTHRGQMQPGMGM